MRLSPSVPVISRPAVILVVIASLALLPATMSAQSQSASAWRDVNSTRAELETRADEMQAQANAARSADEKRTRSLEADLLRRRLREGDFVVGDRVVVRIEEQMTLSDTFTVHSGKILELPSFGAVGLDGALWSEAAERVRHQVATYVKSPRVRVTPLVRIGIMGAVSRPGYYQVPTDIPVADALMHAGGPTANGDASQATVRRGDEEVWPSTAMRDAMARGLTIEQMALRSGDEVQIPEQRRLGTQTLLQIAGILVGVSALALTHARR
jgi:hypothetical protein